MDKEQLEMFEPTPEPGELKFTLVARDPLAAGLVQLWSKLRVHDIASAVNIFADLVSDDAYEYLHNPDTSEQPKVAWQLGEAMRLYERKDK